MSKRFLSLEPYEISLSNFMSSNKLSLRSGKYIAFVCSSILASNNLPIDLISLLILLGIPEIDVKFLGSIFFGPSQKSSKIGARFLAIICLSLIGFGSWAGMSEFDKVITAQAKVISSENLQTIQHFEGGIIQQIHVKSGQIVSAGDSLISLEPLEQEAS